MEKVTWTKYDKDCNAVGTRDVLEGKKGPKGYQTEPCVKQEPAAPVRKGPPKPAEVAPDKLG